MIHTIPNAIPEAAADAFRRDVFGSFFKFTGWEDKQPYTQAYTSHIHSDWSLGDLLNTGFLDQLDARTKQYIGGRMPWKIIVNLATPGETYHQHTHPDQDVLLYYPDCTWVRAWGGETIFYDTELVAVEYEPRKAVYFAGEIPHTIRPPTFAAPHYRTTLSLFYKRDDL